MKTYIVCSDTNYDLMVHVVNADSQEEAVQCALLDGAWGGCFAIEIDTITKGVVFKG
jgi:hypothetical protein